MSGICNYALRDALNLKVKKSIEEIKVINEGTKRLSIV